MAGYRQNLSDIYTGITEGKQHISDKKLSDMYREVLVNEAKLTIKGSDISYTVDIEDDQAREIMQQVGTYTLDSVIRQYLLTFKGYDGASEVDAKLDRISNIFRQSKDATKFGDMFTDIMKKRDPRAVLPLINSNPDQMRIDFSSNGIFKNIVQKYNISPEEMDSVVMKLLANYDMPSGGQNLGKGEVMCLVLGGNVIPPPGKGDLATADSVNPSPADIKGLEVKEGKPRVGSSTNFPTTVPRLIEAYIKDNLNSNIPVEQFKERAASSLNIQLSRLQFELDAINNGDKLLTFVEQSTQSCPKMLNLGLGSIDVIRDIFNNHGVDLGRKGIKAVAERELISLISKELTLTETEVQDALEADAGQRGCPIKVVKLKPAGPLQKEISRTNNQLQAMAIASASVATTYSSYLTTFWAVLNYYKTALLDNNTLLKHITWGVKHLRNFADLSQLNRGGYDLDRDCEVVAKHIYNSPTGLDDIIRDLHLYTGAIQLLGYQIKEEFDDMLFIKSNKGVLFNPIQQTPTINGSKILGLVDLFNKSNMSADLNIDEHFGSSAVHVWFDG